MKKIFIIGGGIAALEAAKSARSTQRDALIVLISAENFLPYSRPMLTKQLMGKVTAQDLAVESAAWYDEKDIVVLTGRTVTAIDPVGKTLVAGGTPFHWDSLILATGASCFVPPIPGADGANVVAVRTFEDVARVREIAKTAKNAAVIGGGVLGLEAASSLAEAGLSVTVLEHGDQLMKRQIDVQAAQHLESAMASKGVKLLKNADSARIDASGVTLVDGTRIPAELVIVSAGVRANIRLAKDAGIAAERHITVDDHMRTNLPDVYAAGDCASMGVSYALWTEAADMAHRGHQRGGRRRGVSGAAASAHLPRLRHGVVCVRRRGPSGEYRVRNRRNARRAVLFRRRKAGRRGADGRHPPHGRGHESDFAGITPLPAHRLNRLLNEEEKVYVADNKSIVRV